MAASIGNHFENIKLLYLKRKYPISTQFPQKCVVFQIRLDIIHLNFCVPFPLNPKWHTSIIDKIYNQTNLKFLQKQQTSIKWVGT